MSLRMSEEEYMEYLEKKNKKTVRQKPKKQAKYNNKKTWIDGICFDSKKEADYYCSLKLLKAAGKIAGFCLQPEFVLQEGDIEYRAITYRADFIIFNLDGTSKIIDVKGYKSQQWNRTKKMFDLKYPNLKLETI